MLWSGIQWVKTTKIVSTCDNKQKKTKKCVSINCMTMVNKLALTSKVISFLCYFTHGDELNTINFIRKKLMKALYAHHRG